MLVAVLLFGYGAKNVLAEDSANVFYVPLIGITSVPDPLALPEGAGDVTYYYAVKNFLKEAPLTGVTVLDDHCSPVLFLEGDDNGDSKLDYSETWRYSCTTKLSETTQSIATATGTANDLSATHNAYSTVVVDSENPAPLVSIINITKVAYPLTLPSEGGDITFTYRVNNPGAVPLSDVVVVDDKCSAMSNKLGDTNGNNLLDTTEVWVYSCTTHLSETTTNTVSVSAFANGLQAMGYATLVVTVAPSASEMTLSLPDTGDVEANPSVKILVWKILSVVLAILILFFLFTQKKSKKKSKSLLKKIIIVLILAGLLGAGVYVFSQDSQDTKTDIIPEDEFGWEYPVVQFPTTGPNDIAYSDIRDPGGIPEGLPVRLKIPIIGVDSVIEDALITPDGKMDVPAGSKNVAWFALGPHPGQEGSAVIGGHFGVSGGVKFVFYDLDKLKVGDKVYVVDDKDQTLAFQVRSIRLFDRDADATEVFTSDDGLAHLNLITCEGIWNRINGLYSERRVVFTDAISAEGSVDDSEGIETPSRTLNIGTRGEDVAELQTFLEQKGFLTIPAGAVKGFFGTLTSAAVSDYQTSVGLSPTGVFEASQLDQLVVIQPSLPSTAIVPTESGSWTLVDGLITFLLCISIVFMSVKIVRRRH